MTAPAVEFSSITVLPDAEQLGALAASHIAQELRTRLRQQATVRMIFAAAPSQSAMLHALASADGVAWDRVEAFHMDEYVGLAPAAPQRFGQWLSRAFFDRVRPGAVHLLDPADDPEVEAARYAALLNEKPVDIVCLGIGMNGHLAFNDPPADFHEVQDARVVLLDRASREQQVTEGLFPSLDEVPTHAVTLSIPRLLRASKLYCCVPGALKTDAVTRAFCGPVEAALPASILREHPDCAVYLDAESAAKLPVRRA